MVRNTVFSRKPTRSIKGEKERGGLLACGSGRWFRYLCSCLSASLVVSFDRPEKGQGWNPARATSPSQRVLRFIGVPLSLANV